MSETLTWDDFKQMIELLETNRVPGPYIAYAHDEANQAMLDAWSRLLRRRGKYLERYRRQGERMKRRKMGKKK